jgi:inorganic pyrophosphatase
MDLISLPAWSRERLLHVVVETPRGAGVKVKLDPDLGAFTVSRPLPAGMVYPYDFGFVPGTRAPDGDPLDAMVYWDVGSWPGVVLECRVLGVLLCDQAGQKKRRERNDRLLVVPDTAERSQQLKSALRLERRVREELESFFLASTALEGKDLNILGWRGPAEAKRVIAAASLLPSAKRS